MKFQEINQNLAISAKLPKLPSKTLRISNRFQPGAQKLIFHQIIVTYRNKDNFEIWWLQYLIPLFYHFESALISVVQREPACDSNTTGVDQYIKRSIYWLWFIFYKKRIIYWSKTIGKAWFSQNIPKNVLYTGRTIIILVDPCNVTD